MKKLFRHFLPLSLRFRFLLATAVVVLVLSLAYGMVALVGYSVSFDKTTFRLLRGESNLFYTLAKWEEQTNQHRYAGTSGSPESNHVADLQ
ncbi:Sensor protein PhoQ [Leclercia adecarboxylata]|uniref:Sensor protein PhoQ n=1 Tax=Leclercia adecarboxylata TaxID=83655 RepID=A0A4U9HQN6_9ENTR|nr:Sensor protein PhoQ [Leclercia adecarboxylata]